MATLIITQGPAADQKFALESHALVMVGRSDDCTFQIVDPRASRKQLQLKQDAEGNHVMTNHSSSNPVRLNGRVIAEPTTLSHGDEIGFGDTTLIYSTDDAADAQTARDAWFKKGQRFKTLGPPDSPASESRD